MNLIKPSAVLAVLGLVSLGFAQASKNYAISPVPHPGYGKGHESFNEISKQDEAQLVFLGDSITQGWDRAGKAVWEKYWAPLKVANLGISGDRTEHVLWRLAHGNFDGLRPKLVVLLIGTSNTGHEGRSQKELDGAVYHCTPEQAADGATVHYLDIGPAFLAPGTQLRDVMPDHLHPNEKGCEIFANVIKAKVDQLMK